MCTGRWTGNRDLHTSPRCEAERRPSRSPQEKRSRSRHPTQEAFIIGCIVHREILQTRGIFQCGHRRHSRSPLRRFENVETFWRYSQMSPTPWILASRVKLLVLHIVHNHRSADPYACSLRLVPRVSGHDDSEHRRPHSERRRQPISVDIGSVTVSVERNFTAARSLAKLRRRQEPKSPMVPAGIPMTLADSRLAGP